MIFYGYNEVYRKNIWRTTAGNENVRNEILMM